ALAFDLREISNGTSGLANFIEQLEAILAQGLVVNVDRHLVEEGIDARAYFGDGTHGGSEILLAHGSSGFFLRNTNGLGKRLLFGQLITLAVRGIGIFPLVLLLLDPDAFGPP